MLRRAHSPAPADYLQDIAGLDLPDFADLGPELTRAACGLRLWLPLQLHGVAAFRTALDAQLDHAELVPAPLGADPHVQVLLQPELSTVVFRCTVPDEGLAAEAQDALTEETLEAINAEGRVFLSSTRLNGRYVGRVCLLNHRLERSHVLTAVETICRHAAAAAARRSVTPPRRR